MKKTVMKYDQTILLKNGKTARLRNADSADGAAVLEAFLRTHAETDYLLTYPDECGFTAAQEAQFLRKRAESPNEIELVALADGKVVGLAGIGAVGDKDKVRHRASFGISVLKDYWGLGLGGALTRACIQCAKDAGYVQLELEAVAENERALAMYQRAGFRTFGRNPKGFRSRSGRYQEVVSMLLTLHPAPETVFESARIRFVRVSEHLLEDYLDMVNDIENVARFIGSRTDALTAEAELRWVRRKLAENAPVFSMLEKDGGAFIGNIELMDVRDGVGELGIAITAKKQNLGYGTEAIPAAVDYALTRLGMDRVFLKVYPENARAIHVYEKCGFRTYDRTEEDVFMAYVPADKETADLKIETERLWLYPVTDAEMRRLIARETDPELRQAYTEMLDGCVREPENRIWHAVWYMELKDRPGTVVGDLSFKGRNADGLPELGYGLRAGCCGNGYMTEAVRGVCAWALTQEGVRGIEAETAPENTASRNVLLRAGFAATGETGEEGPRFRYP